MAMVRKGDTCGACVFYVHRSDGDIPKGKCHALPPKDERMEGGARPGVNAEDQACLYFNDGQPPVQQPSGRRALDVGSE